MATNKKGDKVVDAAGNTWVYTEGGNWRKYVNGKPTSTLSKTNPAGTGAPSPAGGGDPALTSQPVTLQNTPPQSFSPSGTAYLSDTQGALQGQVASGGINQMQADQELARRQAQVKQYSPALQEAQWNLQQQVKSGAINQSQADNELYRLQTLENQSAPEVKQGAITADSSGADIINVTNDVAAGAQKAGNILTNPNEQTAFGNKTVTVDPITGQPIVKQELSDANKQVLGGIQGSSVGASDVLGGLLKDQYGSFVRGAGPQSGPSQELIESIFGQLTKDTARQRQQDTEQLTQTLANRGIPVGSEAYSRSMQDLNTRYDDIISNARNQAVQQGYGTSIAQQGANTQSLGAVNQGVQTLGQTASSGFYNPNFQQFQSVAYQQPNASEIFGQLSGAQLTREGYKSAEKQQEIQAGATLGAAATAAEATKAAAESRNNSQPKPSAFGTRPPGS